jgi:hypothetical protein
VSYLYLASPYSHVDPARRHGRYRAACAATCWLLNIRCWVYSPIVHCHELARLHDLPGDFEFWRMTDSIGVKNEIAYARRNMKPIHLLTPHGMEYVRSDYYKEPVL